MINNYMPSQYRTIIDYDLVFDDGHCNGFAFACNKDGKLLDNIHPCALENYHWCLQNVDRFERFNKVIEHRYRIKDDARGICHCGNEVVLYDMYYGACQCDKCGQWYNLFGQELNPPEQWEEDLEDY